jgi:methionine-rich copper-binding protein CopC
VRRRWLRVLALAAAAVVWPGVSLPHAALIRASPPARASLPHAPSRVELTFSERVEPAYSRASVWDTAGRQVEPQTATVGPDDPRVLSVALPPLAPGTYTVRYRVLSVDGHVVEGAFPFAVRER